MGAAPVLPQAGLAVTESYLEAHGDILPALQTALVEATASVNADPARAASDAAASLGMPWPILEKAIPHSNLVAIPASQARPSLDSMFSTLAEFDPAIIGGSLPDAEFYL
jgi:NitT/TauT family transport system substrate-binding protein